MLMTRLAILALALAALLLWRRHAARVRAWAEWDSEPDYGTSDPYCDWLLERAA
jgi:hypothetical protein